MERASGHSAQPPHQGRKRRLRSPSTAEPQPEPKRRSRPVPSASRLEKADISSDNSKPNPKDHDDRLRSYNRSIEAYEAKQQRRRGLSPTARLREDGEALLQRLKASKTSIVLEESPLSYNGGARCRALDDCIVKRAIERTRGGDNQPLIYARDDPVKIKEDYRIHIDQGSFSDRHLYYHVACFETMVDLKPLIPEMFFMNLERCKGNHGALPRWGLMFRKWFQHKGGIDLGKIAEYLEAEMAREEQHGDRVRQWNDNHYAKKCMERFKLGAQCDCPPWPARPPRPILQDYTTTADEGCSLLDIVKYRYCEMMKHSWFTRADGPRIQSRMEFPENEPTNGDGDQDKDAAETECRNPGAHTVEPIRGAANT